MPENAVALLAVSRPPLTVACPRSTAAGTFESVNPPARPGSTVNVMVVPPLFAPLIVFVAEADAEPPKLASPEYVTVTVYVPGVSTAEVNVPTPPVMVAVPSTAALGAVWLTVAVPPAVVAAVPSDAFLMLIPTVIFLATWSAVPVIDVVVAVTTAGYAQVWVDEL